MQLRIFAWVALSALVHAEFSLPAVTTDQARELVKAALPSWAPKGATLSIDRAIDRPGLYFVSAYGSPNPNGSSLIGYFLVDFKTGDLYDGVVCREYRGAALKKVQTSIRKQIGLTIAEYRRLRRPKPPMCD